MAVSRTTGPPAHEALLDRDGRASWGAIFAGTVTALAVLVPLGLLGLSLGAAAIDPDAADPLGAAPTGTPIWIFLSQLVALGVGGYIAGRLAGVLHTVGSVLHGAVVWALVTLVSAWLATSAALGLVNTVGSALGSAATAARQAAQAAVPEDFELPDMSIAALDFESLPEPIRTRLREEGITPDTFQREAREALRNVISRSEQAQARRAAAATAADIVQNPTQLDAELDQFTDRMFGRGGILGPEDREEAEAVIQRRLGLTEEEATSFLDEVEARAEEIQQDAQQALDEAQQQAQQLADEAADRVGTSAFVAFFASLLGLVAAAGGAVLGRPKRA